MQILRRHVTNRFERQAGFTLIEMLVGLILLGVAAAAVISLVTTSGEGGREVATVAAQNSKMRSAVDAIDTELAEAQKPLLVAGTETATNPPSGNVLAFTRIENDEAGARVYLAERIAYRGPSDTTASLRNTITLQVARQSTPFASTTAALTAATGAPSKVILDKVIAPTATEPLFKYYQNANLAVNGSSSTWRDDVQLVDLILRRDEDGTGNEKFPTAKLSTSIYLRRIGQATEGGNQDLTC